MKIQLYNTLLRRKQSFQPLNSPYVRMYLCGPTVYDRAHIGNARSVVVFDVLFRFLKLAYDVLYVRNITDVDDKIIVASYTRQQSIKEITTQTTADFHHDMAALYAESPSFEPRATDYIDDMIAMIEQLITKNVAYAAEGHVLFAVNQQADYGVLSNADQTQILAGARIEVAPYKKHPSDFVLWKPSSDQEPGWDSPWGYGRPGWHIECSAMSHHFLGETFDIHGGGQDLIFPHHENEMAQSTALFGKNSFAQTWLHNGILTVNGEKMSKSLGNFITVENLLQQADGETIRLALIATHYRQPLDWHDNTLALAKNNLDRFYMSLRGLPATLPAASIDDQVLQALQDDLNTPLALHHLHRIVHEINTAVDPQQKLQLQAGLYASAQIMGLLQKTAEQWFQGSSQSDSPISSSYNNDKAAQINQLIAERQQARLSKDFIKADALRQQLSQMNIVIDDTPSGTFWRYADSHDK